MAKVINVLLIDHVMVREFLSVALRFEEGLTWWGRLGTGRRLLPLAASEKAEFTFRDLSLGLCSSGCPGLPPRTAFGSRPCLLSLTGGVRSADLNYEAVRLAATRRYWPLKAVKISFQRRDN